MQKIYFSTIPLVIASNKEAFPGAFTIESADLENIQKALQSIDNPDGKTLLLIDPDEQRAIENIKKVFTVIQAAGGVAYTQEQEVLLIFRRGKWDLPKGKLDEGESLETCAIREVEEETGLKQVTLENLIQKTYHTYKENGQDVLKETFWYYMNVQKQDLQPQTDEDIEECRWVPKQEITTYFSNIQPSVKDVLERFLAD